MAAVTVVWKVLVVTSAVVRAMASVVRRVAAGGDRSKATVESVRVASCRVKKETHRNESDVMKAVTKLKKRMENVQGQGKGMVEWRKTLRGNEKEVEKAWVDHGAAIGNGPGAREVPAKKAEVPPDDTVQTETKVIIGVEGDEEKVTADRLHQTVPETVVEEKATGSRTEIRVKEGKGNIEGAVRAEVIARMRLDHRP
jgi:hypothetical protein